MNLTAEYMNIDSECLLFREISIDLKKIERSIYNRRKRKLFFAIEFIRNELSKYENPPMAGVVFLISQRLNV